MTHTNRLALGWLRGTTGDIASLRCELERALERREPLDVGFVNPHVVVVASTDATVRRYLDRADLLCIDGVGVVLAQRALGGGRLPRTVAEHLFRAFWERSRSAVDALLIGIEPDAVARAAEALNAVSRGPRVVATCDGFADDRSIDALCARHREVRLVLIGCGTPRSEAIALRVRAALPDAVVFHCGGGTLKTWAGTKRRAPAWLSRAGLEWAHRVAFEPHARVRYLTGLPRFLVALARAPRETGSGDARQDGTP